MQGGKNGTRHVGKVRRFVFHPNEKRLVGFMVKRPDLFWMFRRKDLFVTLDGYDVVDGRIVVRDDPAATGRGACKALGIDWDACILWVGLPVMTEDKEALGIVGSVSFNRSTGTIESLITDSGATANALLGKRDIPADLIRGFRRGMGVALAQTGQEGEATDEVVLGAILVANEAREIPAEGGLAEKAGETTAVVVDKAQKTIDKAKPVVSDAAKKTGEAVNKGAYATGKQIAATKGMFSGFKEEYNKAAAKVPDTDQAIEKPAAASTKSAASKTATAANKSTIAKSSTTAKRSPGAKSAASTKSASATKKATTTKSSSAKKAPAKKSDLSSMFSGFKEEYDKARHDDK